MENIIAHPANKHEADVIKAFLEALDIEFKIMQDSSEEKEYALTEDQLHILEERKERHLKNDSKSYSWKDIKDDLKGSSK